MTNEEIKEIASAMIDAAASWTGLDWSTGNDYDGRPEELAAYRREVESHAAEATEKGADIIRYALTGDVDAALDAAERAAAIERQYGDTPSWGPVLDLVESVIEDGEDE